MPLRLVIPYPLGGLTDEIARLLQEPLRAPLGQPVVVENRGGAAGPIANAPPDGHAMVLTNNGPTSVIPVLRGNVVIRRNAASPR
jgi:tripartite-type tricarboxylate transporter receptor subunit TctC